MSRKLPKPSKDSHSNTESFFEESTLSNRSPLLPVQNQIPSPDVSKKKLIADIRSLSLKVNELQNYTDDIENEKRELLQIKSENENKIAVLEERCRKKDRELNEFRDSCIELEILRSDHEATKLELERVKYALRTAQDIAETAKSLERENDEHLKENSKLQNRIKSLESKVEELKNEVGYRPMYEQVREALATAEKTLADLLAENERARELSEADALDLNSQSHSTPWSRISRGKCTCTCHHNSPSTHQQGDMTMKRFSIISNFDIPSTGASTPTRSKDRQSLCDPSVIDVSLWRDCRTGPNPEDVSGECLGEVMAQDAKIQELEFHLSEARFEINRLNDELAMLNTQNTDLVNDNKIALAEFESKLANVQSEKQNLESELDLKCVVLSETNYRMETLLAENRLITNDLKKIKENSEQLHSELSDTVVQLNETRLEVNKLNLEISALIVQKADLINEHKASLDAFEVKLLNLESAKRKVEHELEQKCIILAKINAERDTFLAENKALSDDLENLKKETDIKISRLEVQLCEARSERENFDRHISELTAQNSFLSAEHKLEIEEFKSKLESTVSEKTNLLSSLDEKSAALCEASLKVEELMTSNSLFIKEIHDVMEKSQKIIEERDAINIQLQEIVSERTALSEKVVSLETEIAQLVERENVSSIERFEVARKLKDAQEDLRTLQNTSSNQISTLEYKVSSLSTELSECQGKLKSSEAHRMELSKRINFLQDSVQEAETHEKELVQQLTCSRAKADELSASNQKLSVDLEEKIGLIKHLRSERAEMIKDKSIAMEAVNTLRAELLQAQKDLAQLSNELHEATNCAIRVDELESSLRTRDSDVSALNQLIQDQKSIISILRDEKTSLELSIESLKADQESKANILDVTLKERDELKDGMAKCLLEFTEEKESLCGQLRELKLQLENQNIAIEKVNEKNAQIDQELHEALKELSLKEGEVISLKQQVSNYISAKNDLKKALDEKALLVDSLQADVASMNKNVAKLEEEASRRQQELILLESDKSSLAEMLEVHKSELMNRETETIGLRDQLSLLVADRERLTNENAQLMGDKAKLEEDLANVRKQYDESRVKTLRRQLSLMLGEHMDTEQNLAEAKKNASLAEMHRQVAESEVARFNKLVNILQKRLDTLMEERMACEERAASETVRCRQLEGALKERDAMIEGLRHELNQLDIQRKSAQEKEASTLREYLKSRAAQDEAERRLALLESRSTFNKSDHRHSFYSLDQIVHQSTSLGEFVPLSSIKRRHSEGRTDCVEKFPPVDLDKSANNRINLSKKVEQNTDRSPLLEERFPLSANKLVFRTPMPPEEPIYTTLPVAAPPHSPILHFLEDTDTALWTPMTLREVAPLSGIPSQVSPIKPKECEKSPSINVVDVAEIPIQVSEDKDEQCCNSAARETPIVTDSLTSVSELENWPPYNSCTVPLSPKSRRTNGILTVRPPFDVHYRRLRRFMIVPAAEEDDLDVSPCSLEEKSLMRTKTGRKGQPSFEGHDAAPQLVMAAEKKPDHVKPSSMHSATARLGTRLQTESQRDSPLNHDADKNEINSRIRLFKSRTVEPKARPASMTDHSDDNSTCSTSISRPAKLARFRSFQDLSDNVTCSHGSDKKSGRSGPPVSFNRFKHRFAIHSHKNRPQDVSTTTITTNESTLRGSNENVSTKDDSLKQKKYAKLRLSNVFKSKKLK